MSPVCGQQARYAIAFTLFFNQSNIVLSILKICLRGLSFLCRAYDQQFGDVLQHILGVYRQIQTIHKSTTQDLNRQLKACAQEKQEALDRQVREASRGTKTKKGQDGQAFAVKRLGMHEKLRRLLKKRKRKPENPSEGSHVKQNISPQDL